MSSPSVARVAAATLTILAYVGVVCLPAFLLWLGWQHLTAELDAAFGRVQP